MSSENEYQWATGSQYVGVIFCVLGVVSGIYHMLNSLSLGGVLDCTY
jgi:hypothetical protein